MTGFVSHSGEETYDDYLNYTGQPSYKRLSKQILPALGYQVYVKDVEQVVAEEFKNYDIVVVISLQHKLEEKKRNALLSAIYSGQSNLLIVGDHTDIYGVQEPYNDIVEPLGIFLNYDSAYPINQWENDLGFTRHTLNGWMWLYGYHNDLGVSVGGSLSVDIHKIRPLLVALDGYADYGTPNAPMLAGLGDQRYNMNEPRGGQILAAERVYGKGRILAYGDTAFLQDTSVAYHFSYIASIFSYLHSKVGWWDSPLCYWIGILGGMIIIILVLMFFSFRYALFFILISFLSAYLGSGLFEPGKVLNELEGRLIVIDNSHGEMFCSRGTEESIDLLIEILGYQPNTLTLVCDVFDADRNSEVSGCILITPQREFSSKEIAYLKAMNKRGCWIVYSGGYYESLPQRNLADSFGFQIQPMTLGAGQDLHLEADEFHLIPMISEAWAIETQGDWRTIVSGYGRDIISINSEGPGKVCVFSDSFLLKDACMGAEFKANNKGFTFFHKLFSELCQG